MLDDRWPVLIGAALLLSLERACYVWIARRPAAFRAWCAGSFAAPSRDPVRAVRALFGGFKVIQAVVFLWWIAVFGGATPPAPGTAALAAGLGLTTFGQFLNASVFYRLGPVGVFYGGELGHVMPRVGGFPFSLVSHPQYVGTVLSIWGLFLTLRFPNPDWWLLPALETAYYAAGARLERGPAIERA